MAEILRELKELRKENQESFTDTKASLSRLETRVGVAEDASQRHEQVLGHLVRREAALTDLCDDLQNRMRRNNLRIYQVPEGSEKGDVAGLKPDNTALPRSIIVRFLDYTVKEAVLRQAWMQKQVQFQGKLIYLDQNYSPKVQTKRARVRGVIKQLKEKGIPAGCHFPAQLRVTLEMGVKTFPTLVEALPTLGELGIVVQVSEREKMDRELSRVTWQRQEDGRRGRGAVSLRDTDLRSFLRD